nr:hypothetical protein [uncultured Kingella sp.]
MNAAFLFTNIHHTQKGSLKTENIVFRLPISDVRLITLYHG